MTDGRQRGHETLRVSEETCQALLAGLPNIVMRCDCEGRRLFVSGNIGEMTGLPAAQFIGKTSRELGFSETCCRRWEEAIRGVCDSGEPRDAELPLEGKQGERAFAWRLVPEFDAQGAVESILSISREVMAPDAAERQRAQEALRESEERYRALFDRSLDCVYISDFEGHFLDANQAILDLLGYRREDIATTTLASLLPEDQLPMAFQRVEEIRTTGRQRDPAVYRLRHKDGRDVFLEIQASLIYHHGKPYAIQGIARDITERKRAEAYREMGGEVLRILDEQGPLGDSIQRVLSVVKARTGVDAVGIRLEDGEDFPYSAQDGFSTDFLRTENTLIERGVDGGARRDADGHVRLECMCGLVICGKTDPSNPLFTPGGSCWSNDSSTILDIPPDQGPRCHTRKRCIQHGYASVALVPIRTKDRIVGLLQLIDRRKGCFSLAVIEQLEGIAAHIGQASMRRRAEEALRESEAQFRDLFDSAPVAYHELDGDGALLRVNRAECELLGYQASEMVGRPVWDFIAGEDRDSSREVVRRKLSGELPLEPCQRRYLRRDGGEVWIEIHDALVRNATGQPVGIRTALLDITERKRAEEEKAKLQAQLHQAQKMESIGRLAGGVAHDFNNLLTVINGYSRLLLGKAPVGDPLRDSLEEIQKAGERAAVLTRQLLAFSRKQVLRPCVLDLNRVVEEMRPMLGRVLGEDVHVRVALRAGGATVNADPHQLEQVIMNLVVNSRDAMPHGGQLSIETSVVEWSEDQAQSHLAARAGRYVMLAVSDTGAGMDEETRRRIFEPFFTTKEVGKGTGLGLSMVQGIVEQSGGYIGVYSEPGLGTAFKIYLPEAVAAPAGSRKPDIAPVPVTRGRETVLVVEDQTEVRKFAAFALSSYGYRVIQASNAGEALLLCERERERERIDLVLTDVVMPNMSGKELADRLGRRWPGIKVLFMSGYTDDAIVHHGVLDKSAEFIQKPFSPDQLAAKVQEMLARPERPACVLVADDEAGVRGFFRKVLEDGGYKVVEAANGIEALEEARTGRVDLVITDLVMPEQEGIETIQALRKDMPGIGIIAMSGGFGEPYLRMAGVLGAHAVLTKPVSPETLLARVAEVLKSRR